MQVNSITPMISNNLYFEGRKHKKESVQQESSGNNGALKASAVAALFLLPVLAGCGSDSSPKTRVTEYFTPVKVVTTGQKDPKSFDKMERDSMIELEKGTYYMQYNQQLMFRPSGSAKWQPAGKMELTEDEYIIMNAIAKKDYPAERVFDHADIINVMSDFTYNEFFKYMHENLPDNYKMKKGRLTDGGRTLEFEVLNKTTGKVTAIRLPQAENMAKEGMITIGKKNYVPVVGVGSGDFGTVYQKFFMETGMRFNTRMAEYKVTEDGQLLKYVGDSEDKLFRDYEAMHRHKKDAFNWVPVDKNEIPMVMGEMEVIQNFGKQKDDNKDLELWWCGSPIISKDDFKVAKGKIKKHHAIPGINPERTTREKMLDTHTLSIKIEAGSGTRKAGFFVVSDKL